jgi:hypothetical protein
LRLRKIELGVGLVILYCDMGERQHYLQIRDAASLAELSESVT